MIRLISRRYGRPRRRTGRYAAATAIAVALAGAGAATSPSTSQAATRPAWCPSWLTSGVAVEFGANRILPGRMIGGTDRYTYRNNSNRPSTVQVSWAEQWSVGATVTVSVGAEYGVSVLATVKAHIDSSVQRSVSRSAGFVQTLTIPSGQRLMTYWAIDLRQTTMRFHQYRIGCQRFKTSSWTTFTAPRGGTVKPWYRAVY